MRELLKAFGDVDLIKAFAYKDIGVPKDEAHEHRRRLITTWNETTAYLLATSGAKYEDRRNVREISASSNKPAQKKAK